MLREAEDPDFLNLTNHGLDCFLNGLVIYKRGPKPGLELAEGELPPAPERQEPFTNNVVFKKFRVAFALKDVDLMAIFESVDFRIQKPELSALMRAYGHKNYKLCGDQVLRYFLKGLAQREHAK